MELDEIEYLEKSIEDTDSKTTKKLNTKGRGRNREYIAIEKHDDRDRDRDRDRDVVGASSLLYRWASTPTNLYSPERALRHIAEKRGFKDTYEVLASLGKQNTNITLLEALDLMGKELGLEESLDYTRRIQYSSPSACEWVLRRYKERIRARDPYPPTTEVKTLKKYCCYCSEKGSDVEDDGHL